MLGRLCSQLRSQWVGTLALFLVLAGGGAYAAFDPVGRDGDIDACFQKKSGDLDIQKGKKCGKREKLVSWAQSGPQGEPGTPGAEGPPGADATNLFAYIREADPAPEFSDATIQYGKGVTAVSDPDGANDYVVTFNRSLENCVVQAISARGTPDPGNSAVFVGVVPHVVLHPAGEGTVRVGFHDPHFQVSEDTGFFITAFC